MPFPILAALGIAGSTLSAIELLRNIARTGEKPDPATIAKAIEEKAALLSRQNGVPMEQAKAAVAEQTTKDVSSEFGFDPTAAVFQVLGLVPGVGMLAKGAKIGKEAGTGLAAGVKSVANNQGGLTGSLTGGLAVDEKTNAMQLLKAGGKLPSGPSSNVVGMGAKSDVRGIGSATDLRPIGATSDIRGMGANTSIAGMGSATDLAEVGTASPLTRYRGVPGERTVTGRGTPQVDERGFVLDDGVDYPLSADVRRMDAPRIGMGQQNFKTVDVPYEVMTPPYNPTLGLPLDPMNYADMQFRRQLMARQMAMREADAAGDFSGYAAY
jgi:hypothetical protein